MDILEETDVFLSACQLTQDESNNLVFNGITGCFESKYLADWFVNQINFGWKLWRQAQAVPEGYVLMPIKPTETMVMAVVKEHEGDAFLPYSLYDAYVKQAMIEAQEPAND